MYTVCKRRLVVEKPILVARGQLHESHRRFCHIDSRNRFSVGVGRSSSGTLPHRVPLEPRRELGDLRDERGRFRPDPTDRQLGGGWWPKLVAPEHARGYRDGCPDTEGDSDTSAHGYAQTDNHAPARGLFRIQPNGQPTLAQWSRDLIGFSAHSCVRLTL